jgi:RNA polymerase sigma-70 factor (ECF subfamily)
MPELVFERSETKAIGTIQAARLYYHVSKILDARPFDESYVSKLAGRDPVIVEHFTSYFGQLISIILRRKLRSPRLIEDIRQETFLRVLRIVQEKGGLEHPDRLGPFVRSVCQNVMLETLRSDMRQLPFPEHCDPADESTDLDAELVTEERKSLIRRVLKELSDKDRRILQMLFLDERDRDEICRSMRVDRRYLRVLVFRARKRFRDVMTRSERVVAGEGRLEL